MRRAAHTADDPATSHATHRHAFGTGTPLALRLNVRVSGRRTADDPGHFPRHPPPRLRHRATPLALRLNVSCQRAARTADDPRHFPTPPTATPSAPRHAVGVAVKRVVSAGRHCGRPGHFPRHPPPRLRHRAHAVGVAVKRVVSAGRAHCGQPRHFPRHPPPRLRHRDTPLALRLNVSCRHTRTCGQPGHFPRHPPPRLRHRARRWRCG